MENMDGLAKALYEAYCEAVGGHSAVTNTKLPTWEELKADDSKVKVVAGWNAVAVRSRQSPSTFAEGPVGGSADSNANVGVEGEVQEPEEQEPANGE